MPENVDSAASAENPMVKTESAAEALEAQLYTVEQVAEIVEKLNPEATPTQLDHPRLKDTGNGPDVSYEEAALEALYGPPDADGVYGKGGDDA